MDDFVLTYADWQRDYNCSVLTPAQWAAFGARNMGIGVYCLLFGVVLMTIYVTCLIALVKNNLQNRSCYRIMLVLGVFDVISLMINSFYNGISLISGYVFCSAPHVMFIAGCILDGVWAAEGALSVLLAVNRCADFWKWKFLKRLFEGSAINFWLGAVLLYALYFALFPPPPVFSSQQFGVWFTDPYVNLQITGISHDAFSNWQLLVNNLIVVFALPVLYTALVLSIRFSQTTAGKKRHHKQVAIQALMICLLNFLSSFLYVYMHFLPTHRFMLFVCLVGWQASSGSGGVIYFIFNKAIRTAVLGYFPSTRKVTFNPATVFSLMVSSARDELRVSG